MEFKPGDRVRVVQGAPLKIGGMLMDGNVFDGVRVVRKNPDGSYQIAGIISTPEGDELTIPADWIFPARDAS